MNFAEYGTLLTEAYDIDKPEAPAAELAWHRTFIEGAGQPVLALMCGSGRFLVPLLAGGFDIDGVDASPDMLGACRRKLEARSLTTDLFEQKLQELDLPRRYGCAYVGGGGSFGLIASRDDAFEALRKIHAQLDSGGRLCLEAQTTHAAPLYRVGRADVRSWVRPDGARIVLTSSVVRIEDNVAESIGKYELFQDRRLIDVELDDFPIRLYEPEEMTVLLERAGFRDILITKAYSDEPPGEGELLLSYRAGV